MGRFVEGADRSQLSFLPECLEDWVDEDNPVQVIEAFVEALDLAALGFDARAPANRAGQPTIRPCCSSSTSTAISTGCSRAGGSSGRLGATSS